MFNFWPLLASEVLTILIMARSTDPLLSDTYLVKLLKEHNEAAFQQIFERYRNDIYTYAKTLLRSDVAAEEVVQEVFLRIWQKTDQLNPDLSLRAFLFTMCRNLCFDALRKIANNKKLCEEIFYTTETSHNQIQDGLFDQEYEQIKQGAIEKLPPKRKLIFQMSREREMSYEEISTELGISTSTVKSQMNKALKHMRNQLERQTDLILTLVVYFEFFFFSR